MTPPDDPASPPARGPARAALPGEHGEALPAGTRLREFEIVSVIGQGGFGIVYLAHDRTLDRRVALKEYMPGALATRRGAMTVSVRSSRHDDTFAAGLRSFINEARLLAQFDHPSLLKVYQFWEDHGTAYMVMPFYEGITLDKLLPRLGGPPDEAWLRALLDPLLDALELLHAARCYHRDVAPDNILILPDGRPLLLDFGAARQVIGEKTHALTVILKTGYAPVEQYGEMPDMRQGPWTDLYALASVVEFAITGKTPPQAVARFLGDKREPLAVRADGRYSDNFLAAIDRALAVQPGDRPQSVADLRALLARGASGSAPLDLEIAVTRAPRAQTATPGRAGAGTRAVASTPRAEAGFAATTHARDTPAPPPRGRQRPWLAGLSAAAVTFGVVGGGAWFLLRPAPGPEPTVASAPAQAVEAAPATVPVETVHAATTAVTTAAVASAPAAMPTEAAVLPPPASRPAEPPPLDDRVEATIRELLPPQARDDDPPAAVPAVPTSPPAAGTNARRTAEPARPRNAEATAPRSEPAEPRTARTPARRTVPQGRCEDIIQRASLGEDLSDADKTHLKQECRP